MRVVVIIPSFYPAIVYGGSTFASYHLTKAAAESGVDLWVSTTNANGCERLDKEVNIFQSLDQFKIKYYHEELVNYFSSSYIFGIFKDIKNADVVHIQSIFSYPTPLALFYSMLFRKKVLLSPRGSLAQWSFQIKGWHKKQWIKCLITPFIKTVTWHATSEKEKNDILKIFPKAHVKIISDGTFLDQSKTALTRVDMFNSLSLKESRYIAAMGRIHPVKGYDILIKSFQIIKKSNPDLKLLIAGSDEGDLKHLTELVSSFKLDNQVVFVGPVSGATKESFLQNAELLVLPSHTENFGIVVVEALAQGTPVVASNKTPWRVLEKFNAGYWVENTTNEIAHSIINLLSNTTTNWEMNAKLLSKEFDWYKIAKRYKHILEEIHNG